MTATANDVVGIYTVTAWAAPGAGTAAVFSLTNKSPSATVTVGGPNAADAGNSMPLNVTVQFPAIDGDGDSIDSFTINWGDGNTTTTGTITHSGPGNWTIAASHTYSSAGSYSIGVGITDAANSTFSANGTATIINNSLTANGVNISAHQDVQFNGEVATFTDSNSNTTASSYTATIDWGDGTTSPGTITSGQNGWIVDGSHVFANVGQESISVGITGLNGTTATAVSTATITASPLVIIGADPILVSAVSRKTHGSAGTFDISLPLSGAPGIEDRQGGPTQVVLTFAAPIHEGSEFSVMLSSGSASSSSVSGSTLTIDLSGATNGQTLVVNISDIRDSTTGASGNYSLDIGVLLGDVNGDGLVNQSDLNIISADSGQTTSASNFRADIGEQGTIDSEDTTLATSEVGSTLAPASRNVFPTGPFIYAIASEAFSGDFAFFTDTAAGPYNATINWSDGGSSAGTITSNGSGGWLISGSHTYSSTGTFQPTVTVQDAAGNVGILDMTAKVVSVIENPQPQIDLTATATTTGTIDLRWVDVIPGATGYEIDRSSDGSDYSELNSGAPNSSGYSIYEDTDLTPNTTYYYRVEALGIASPLNIASAASATTATGTGYNSTVLTAPIVIPVAPIVGSRAFRSPEVLTPVLQNGVHYELVASGMMVLGGPLGMADADYAFSLSNNDTLSNSNLADKVNYGIGVNDSTLDQNKYAYWGTYNPAHVYMIDVVGTGQSLSLDFHDDYYGDNYQTGPATQLEVTIYEQNAATQTSLTATAVSTSEIDLSWPADTTGTETEYKIYRSNTFSFTPNDRTNLIQTVSSNPSGNSYHDTNLTDGTQYYYEVVGVLGSGLEAAPIGPASATTLLAAPINLAAQLGTTSAYTLTWTNVSYTATAVLVQQSTSGASGSYTTIATLTPTSGNGNVMPDSYGVSNTQAWYRVYAENQSLSPTEDSTLSNTVEVDAPVAITGLTATTISNSEIQLTWNGDETGQITTYEIYRSTTANGINTSGQFIREIGNPETAIVTYVDNNYGQSAGLTDGTTYYYVVVGIDGHGNVLAESNLQSPARATTFLPGPSNLQVTQFTAGQFVTLSWTNNTTNSASWVDIEHSSDGVNYTIVGHTNNAATDQFTDNSISSGGPYVYRVQTETAEASSIYSNTLTVSTGPTGEIQGQVFEQNSTDDAVSPPPPPNPTVALTQIGTGANEYGVVYYEPDNSVIVSAYDGASQLLEVFPDGQTRLFATLGSSPPSDEENMTSVQSENAGAGFVPGDIFVGNGHDIERVTDGGKTVIPDWVTLPTVINGGYYGNMVMDTGGAFGGNLVVLTEDGGVYLVDAQGTYAQLHVVGLDGDIEAISVLPKDSSVWGPYAGDIVFMREAGASANGTPYLFVLSLANSQIDQETGPAPQLVVSEMPVNGDPAFDQRYFQNIENLNVIPTNQSFFGLTGPQANIIYTASSSQFVGLGEDLLATGEGAQSYILYYQNGQVHAVPFSTTVDGTTQIVDWEQTVFGSAAGPTAPSTLQPLAGQTVYIDENNSGQWEPGDPTTVTDANGDYAFIGLTTGTYSVSVALPSGWQQISPTQTSYEVTVGLNEDVTGIDFSVEQSPAAPDHSPVITSTPISVATLGQEYTYSFTAEDPDPGDTLTYDLPLHPSGMSLDTSIPGHPEIVWDVPDAPSELGSVLLRVTDSHGKSAVQPFTIDFVENVSTPAIEATAASSSSINVSWAPILNAQGYFIERSTSTFSGSNDSYLSDPTSWVPYVPANPPDSEDGNDTVVYTDTGLSPDTSYYYRVEAAFFDPSQGPQQPETISENSNIQEAATYAPASLLPGIPVGLDALSEGGDAVQLQWQANTDPFTAGYNIYRSTTDVFSMNDKIGSATGGEDDTSYTDSPVVLGTTYYYWVTAYSSPPAPQTSQESLPSPVASTVPNLVLGGAYLSSSNSTDGNQTTFTAYVGDSIPNDTSLVYRITAVNGPPGSQVVFRIGNGPQSTNQFTFSATGNVVNSYGTQFSATFNKAGTYDLQLTAVNAEGESTPYDESSFIVVAEPTTIKGISPFAPIITAGGSVQFTADVDDQFGDPIAPANLQGVTWQVTADPVYKMPDQGNNAIGTINSLGAYTIPVVNDTLEGADQVTATIRTLSGTSLSASTSIAINPPTQALLPPPTDVTATAISSSQIELQFIGVSDPGGPTPLYQITRTDQDGNTVVLPTATTYTYSDPYFDQSLTPGMTYTYTVQTLDPYDNLSAPSNAASATTWSAPTEPTGVTANALSGSQIKVTWDDDRQNSPDTAGWEIWYAQGGGNTPPDQSQFTPLQPAGQFSPVNYDYVQNLSPSTSYWFEVRAVDSADGEDSPFSTPIQTTTLSASGAPLTPANVQAGYAGGQRVGISWTPDSGDDALLGYDIYRSATNNFTPTADALIGSSANPFYTDDGVPNSISGQEYYYAVVAVNDSGLGNGTEVDSAPGYSSSGVIVGSSSVTQPSAPTNLALTTPNGVSWDYVSLHWQGDDVHAAGFDIERAPYNSSNWQVVGQVTQFATTFTDTSVIPNTAYQYEVIAYSIGGPSSPPSNILPVTTPAIGYVPNAPGQPTVVSEQYNQVTIAWPAAEEGTVPYVGYNVYRAVVSAQNVVGSWTLLNSSPIEATTYQDLMVIPGTTYEYEIESVTVQNNRSVPSPTLEVQTYPPPTGTAPVVKITSLTPTPTTDSEADNTQLQMVKALTEVYGTVSDVYPNNSVSWTLSLVLTGGAQDTVLAPITVAEGNGPVGSEGSPGFLGAVDPSLYPSGSYNLTLTATDQTNNTTSSTTTAITLFSNIQLGNFTLPVTDMTVNVPGQQPIVIQRTYDSSKAGTETNLGYGWQFDVSNTNLSTTAIKTTRSGNSTSFLFGDLVYITMPDGGQHVFQFLPVPSSYNPGVDSDPLGLEYTGDAYRPQFVCVDGSGATLSVQNDSPDPSNYYLTYDPSTHEFFADTDTGQTPYNPALSEFGGTYTLTTTDRTSYTVNAQTGDITSSEDSNGNITNYSSDTVMSANGGPQVEFIPVGGSGANANLVAKVTIAYPASYNIPTNDVPAVYYNYDSNGNLVSVSQPDGITYDYTYQNHFLTNVSKVVNGTAVTVASATYDQKTGELTTLTGAVNHAATVNTGSSDGTSTTQVVTDPAGDQTTDIYDSEGDVIRKIQPGTNSAGQTGYLVTCYSFTYDGFDLQTAIQSGQSGENELLGQTDYQPFFIIGSDSSGARYTQSPTTVAESINYYTPDSGSGTSADFGQIQSETVYGA